MKDTLKVKKFSPWLLRGKNIFVKMVNNDFYRGVVKYTFADFWVMNITETDELGNEYHKQIFINPAHVVYASSSDEVM